MPVDLEGWSLNKRVQAGERVEKLLEGQAFEDLCEVVSLHHDGVLAQLKHSPPRVNSSEYADAIGHLRGLEELPLIARGIVEDGKIAAGEQRRAEQGES